MAPLPIKLLMAPVHRLDDALRAVAQLGDETVRDPHDGRESLVEKADVVDDHLKQLTTAATVLADVAAELRDAARELSSTAATLNATGQMIHDGGNDLLEELKGARADLADTQRAMAGLRAQADELEDTAEALTDAAEPIGNVADKLPGSGSRRDQRSDDGPRGVAARAAGDRPARRRWFGAT